MRARIICKCLYKALINRQKAIYNSTNVERPLLSFKDAVNFNNYFFVLDCVRCYNNNTKRIYKWVLTNSHYHGIIFMERDHNNKSRFEIISIKCYYDNGTKNLCNLRFNKYIYRRETSRIVSNTIC